MTKIFIYVISDGTGETAMSLIKAALVHYPQKDMNVVRCKNIRNNAQVESLIEEAFEKAVEDLNTKNAAVYRSSSTASPLSLVA